MIRIPGACVRDRLHTFDRDSGWCVRGCGWRDDGTCSHPANPADALELIDVTEPRHRPEEELFA